MKTLMKIILIVLILILSNKLLAQGPPDPPGNPNFGGGPVGGSAPISDSGLTLIVFSLAYGGFKWRKIQKAAVSINR